MLTSFSDELLKLSHVLTSLGRNHIAKKNFAVPSKSGAGKYPIEDASHARNAMARVSQFGSPSEQAKVRAKVHAKYPGIGNA